MSETDKRWHVLGHPAWPAGIDFSTPAAAEKFFWGHPKVDGTRDGMTVLRIDTIRYEPYVPAAEVRSAVRCDYCGDDLPSVKSRAHVPTTPNLQRLGFAADKVVCPECVDRVRSTATTDETKETK